MAIAESRFPESELLSLTYERFARSLYRKACLRQETVAEHRIDLDASSAEFDSYEGLPAGKAWHLAHLRGFRPEATFPSRRSLRAVDLFCGCGGLAEGVRAAAEAFGFKFRTEFAADIDPTALEVYAFNHNPALVSQKNIDGMVDAYLRRGSAGGRFAYPPEIIDPLLKPLEGEVDIVMGGPPCQGHSNFNNHSRRADPKNRLYSTVASIGVALKAPIIIIENVPTVVRDKGEVVQRTLEALEEAEYFVSTCILQASHFGAPQDRKRHFLIATKHPSEAARFCDLVRAPALTAGEALTGISVSNEPYDRPASLSKENQERIAWLFESGDYNLPNEIRPDCHKDGHSYPSVYGRIYPDRPAQTITGGFLSPGRGRFIHPFEPRGLTPHEGARLQGFSDCFHFRTSDADALNNSAYSKLIGNAVPPPLGFAIGAAAIGSLLAVIAK